jgi:hypothetical protein
MAGRAWHRYLRIAPLERRVREKDERDLRLSAWDSWRHVTRTHTMTVHDAFNLIISSGKSRLLRLRDAVCAWARAVYAIRVAHEAAKVRRLFFGEGHAWFS